MVRSPHEILLILISAAWRRRVLIYVPMLVLPVLGLLASFVMPRSYEARMTILIQEPAKLNPFMKDFSIGANVKERMPALDALLHSDHILAKVASDIGRINEGSSRQERDGAVRALSGAVAMQLVGNDILELRVRGPQSQGLSRTLAAVSDRLIERLVAPERAAVGDSERFLAQQLAKRRKELDAAEKELTDFRATNSRRLPSVYAGSVTRLTELKSKLEQRTMDLSAAEAAFADLRKRLSSTNPVVGQLEQSIVQVSGELATLRARYTADHSEVIAARRKLQRLQDERREVLAATRDLGTEDVDRLWNIAAGMSQGDRTTPPLLVTQIQNLQEAQSKRAALQQEVDMLKHAIEELQSGMSEFVPIEQRQQQLERVLTVARETYDGLAKRYEMARVTGALGTFEAPERVKVLDTSGDPSSPTSPPRIVYVLGALIGGLFLGISLSVIAELIDPTIRHARDFAHLIGRPILGRLPRILPT